MLDVFELRRRLIDEYASFSRSFSRISAEDISTAVAAEYERGRYWPEPLVQINPKYRRDGTVGDLVRQGLLHSECEAIFQANKVEGEPKPIELFAHQLEAIATAKQPNSFVVTTGTGSGKSLTFFIPIIDAVLRGRATDSRSRTRAIVIYPMNALANSQLEELDKFLCDYPEGRKPFTVARYTGQEDRAEREAIAKSPPDILLTNFMMLELILTRYEEIDRRVVENCRGLEFIVLDELHTYRGRQGADVAMLVRRLRQRMDAVDVLCIGTSATMSSTGSDEDQRKTVADVASRLFGTSITQHEVIGETLERVSDESLDLVSVRPLLASRMAGGAHTWPSFSDFRKDPLAVWVELKLGIDMSSLSKPRRASPCTLSDAARQLDADTGVGFTAAREGLQRFLVAASAVRTPQGNAPFAFKLHQFISGPGKVMTTLEPEGTRHITLDPQRYAPGRKEQGVLLYAAHFCRECGQEYHPVWRDKDGHFQPREIDDVASDDADAPAKPTFGFLAPRRPGQSYQGLLDDLPENWLDLTRAEPKIKPGYRNAVPLEQLVDAQGRAGSGQAYWFLPGKFRFCVGCGFAHDAYGKDVNRLSSLSGEGRSSATTMLTLSLLRQLFSEKDLPPGTPDPRKLLGFSDNRQDAALQAGHFNDLVFLLTLRSGLIGALRAGSGALSEEQLPDAVFRALGFDRTDEATLAEYLKTPKLVGLARQEAQRTVRFILGYRLMRDLRKGWRFNNPNLDQLRLLRIDYQGLAEFCADDSIFAGRHSALERLGAKGREGLSRLVFDELRRSLCLESRYLDSAEQDKARTSAFSYLNERWAFAPDEQLATAKLLIFGNMSATRGCRRCAPTGRSDVSLIGTPSTPRTRILGLASIVPPCGKRQTSQCAHDVLEKEPRIIRLSCSVDLLKSLPPFSSLTDAQFAVVLPSIQRRKYAARTYILEAGQRSDGLYVVLSGSVRLLLHDAKGRELIAGIIGPNEFFGEAGVSDTGPLATSVRSQEACELLYVPNKTVLKVFQYDPTTAVVMLRTVIDRLSDAHRKMATLAMVDVYGRVARFLLEYARETNGEWIVDTGSHGIAAMVGCSREMVTRVTKDMIKKGLVRRQGRQLIVLDRVVLANTSKTHKY